MAINTERHDRTFNEFARLFNECPIEPNIKLIINPVETGLADGIFIDLDHTYNVKDNGIYNSLLSIDWDCHNTPYDFRKMKEMEQFKRKINEYTDIGLRMNAKTENQIAMCFTDTWKREDDTEKEMYSAKEDANVTEKLKITDEFGVWNTNNIKEFKSFIAQTLKHGFRDEVAFSDYTKNGGNSMGKLKTKSQQALDAIKESYKKIEITDRHKEIFKFADKFNNLPTVNNFCANVLMLPLEKPNGKFDAWIVNLTANTKMAFKFDETAKLDINNLGQMIAFKDICADALGVGYCYERGQSVDVDKLIAEFNIENSNDKKLIQMREDRLYSMEIASNFQDKTFIMKNDFMKDINSIDKLMNTLEEKDEKTTYTVSRNRLERLYSGKTGYNMNYKAVDREDFKALLEQSGRIDKRTFNKMREAMYVFAYTNNFRGKDLGQVELISYKKYYENVEEQVSEKTNDEKSDLNKLVEQAQTQKEQNEKETNKVTDKQTTKDENEK